MPGLTFIQGQGSSEFTDVNPAMIRHLPQDLTHVTSSPFLPGPVPGPKTGGWTNSGPAPRTLNTIQVPTWDLDLAESAEEALPPYTYPIGDHEGEGPNESVFDPDLRRLVSPSEYGPNGKYRGIVKLQMRYEGQATSDPGWAMGTGWLIADNILVTAGHCAYSHKNNYKRCIKMRCYVGYNGRASVSTGNVQMRWGRRIATTKGWLMGSTHRVNDVSFIQLDRPFTGVQPFRFSTTPSKNDEVIGVVGYPADKSLGQERGAQMYQLFQKVSYNLNTSKDHMLEHRISTFGGNSGSPVLRKGTNIAIGVHVYGGGDTNLASPINTKYGNPFRTTIQVFKKRYPVVQNKNGIKYMQVPKWDPKTAETEAGESTETDEESFGSFLKTLKRIIKVGAPIASNILKVGSPFLGPIGGPIAAAAGVALRAASRLAETAITTGDVESAAAQSFDSEDFESRAILGEAALQTVLGMQQTTAAELQIFAKMSKIYARTKPHWLKLAPKVLPVVNEPALRIALKELAKARAGRSQESDDTTANRQELTFSQELSSGDENESAGLDAETMAFVEALLEPTLVSTETSDEDSEGFFDSLGDLLYKGMLKSPSIFETMESGLGNVAGELSEADDTQSSSEAGPDGDVESAEENEYTTLFERQLMGEAALQALSQIPVGRAKEEGFFDIIKTVVQQIGPVVKKVAPKVIKHALPIIVKILTENYEGVTGTESGTTVADWIKSKDNSVPSTDPAAPNGPTVPTAATAPVDPSASSSDVTSNSNPTGGLPRSLPNGTSGGEAGVDHRDGEADETLVPNGDQPQAFESGFESSATIEKLLTAPSPAFKRVVMSGHTNGTQAIHPRPALAQHPHTASNLLQPRSRNTPTSASIRRDANVSPSQTTNTGPLIGPKPRTTRLPPLPGKKPLLPGTKPPLSGNKPPIPGRKPQFPGQRPPLGPQPPLTMPRPLPMPDDGGFDFPPFGDRAPTPPRNRVA